VLTDPNKNTGKPSKPLPTKNIFQNHFENIVSISCLQIMDH